jgi:hypothetical protein
VRNHAHPISDYITAMIAAGFRIDSFVDPAFKSPPFVLIWEATLA